MIGGGSPKTIFLPRDFEGDFAETLPAFGTLGMFFQGASTDATPFFASSFSVEGDGNYLGGISVCAASPGNSIAAWIALVNVPTVGSVPSPTLVGPQAPSFSAGALAGALIELIVNGSDLQLFLTGIVAPTNWVVSGGFFKATA